MAKGAVTGVGRIRVLAKTGRRAGRGLFSSQTGRLDMRRQLDINDFLDFVMERIIVCLGMEEKIPFDNIFDSYGQG